MAAFVSQQTRLSFLMVLGRGFNAFFGFLIILLYDLRSGLAIFVVRGNNTSSVVECLQRILDDQGHDNG